MPDEDIVPDSASDFEELEPVSQEAVAAIERIEARCKAATLPFERMSTPFAGVRIGMRCGREVRWCYLASPERIIGFSDIEFEKWVFLSGYEAICSYEAGVIEAGFQQSDIVPTSFALRRLFDTARAGAPFDMSGVKLILGPPEDGLPTVEVSPPSEVFSKLASSQRQRLTLKLTGCNVAQHDKALSLLRRVAGPMFFQIDLLADVPIALERERRRFVGARKSRKAVDLRSALQYPKTEMDDAPLSLYWYGRSASRMPLLQFLAFYQVLEFYFPIYSQTEAQRKLKTILKDPTFRGDRDTDIVRLLSAIQVSRGGGYGDERSQLRATLLECIDASSLRDFLESDADRKEFYVGKDRVIQCHGIPLANASADLRGDVAERLYDIRCKIVHTKSDSQSADVEPMLPFSKEAEHLLFDIELVQYLARQVLIAGSRPLRSTA